MSDSAGGEAKDGLKKKALRGGIVEMGGYALSQVLRLGGNLLLTRLLFPEAFGLMTTLMVINTGLVMLSDVGIEQAVIRSEHAEDERFLNTAWSLQIIRGLALWGIATALAYPLAWALDETQLAWMIPVTSLNVLFAAFGSTSEFTLRREMRIGRIMTLDLGIQVISLGLMLGAAYVWPSVWVLVVGTLTREAFRVIGTHIYFDVGYRNRWFIDPEHRKDILGFGTWILFSSAVFFLAGFADRPLLLRYITAAGLGVYSIAALLSDAAFTVIGKVIHGVLYPVFGRIRLEGTEALRDMYYHARLRLDAVAMLGIGLLATVGPWLVDLLWDPRYHEAGWMLQVLCVKAATRAIFDPAEKCLMALGKVRVTFVNNLMRTIFLFAAVPVGWHLGETHAADYGIEGGGVFGVVVAVALTDLPSLFVLWPAMHKEGVLRPLLELRTLLFLAIALALGTGIAQLLALIPLS